MVFQIFRRVCFGLVCFFNPEEDVIRDNVMHFSIDLLWCPPLLASIFLSFTFPYNKWEIQQQIYGPRRFSQCLFNLYNINLCISEARRCLYSSNLLNKKCNLRFGQHNLKNSISKIAFQKLNREYLKFLRKNNNC